MDSKLSEEKAFQRVQHELQKDFITLATSTSEYLQPMASTTISDTVVDVREIPKNQH